MNLRARASPASPDPQEGELNTEIASIRAEIQNLKRRKRFLSSSLLSSTSIQTLLRKPPPPNKPTQATIHEDLSPLATAAGKHSTANHHRIAFGTTAFPFQDPSPSPTAKGENLLGLRIDVCTRNGRFAKPYYVLLRRERVRGENGKRLRVHRHTIPAFIALSKLEGVYLPFPGSMRKAHLDAEEGSSDAEDGEPLKAPKGQKARKQDLRGFVRELRRELVSWHLRSDAVDLLREKLGLGDEDNTSSPSEKESGTGIVSLAPTAIETRYVRLEWEDGRVGRFKVSNTGIVERAVVIGDKGRDQRTEEAMTGGGGRVEGLLERLRKRGEAAA